ncbi:hypothetical protein U9M48_002692 [Paspalum notatum var. saurae]|uniref:Uncharacterized protein n=1 Tax=Paspalum notatum var. saurae TaxID=547442 RepID=A0AAQ3SHM6_PASNO
MPVINKSSTAKLRSYQNRVEALNTRYGGDQQGRSREDQTNPFTPSTVDIYTAYSIATNPGASPLVTFGMVAARVLQPPRVMRQEDIQSEDIASYLCTPARSAASPKGLSLISSFLRLLQPLSM